MAITTCPLQANLWSNAWPEEYHGFLHRNKILGGRALAVART
jgi:hypothetical protein